MDALGEKFINVSLNGGIKKINKMSGETIKKFIIIIVIVIIILVLFFVLSLSFIRHFFLRRRRSRAYIHNEFIIPGI